MTPDLAKMVVYHTDDLPDEFQKYVDTSLDIHIFKHPLLVTLMPLTLPEPLEDAIERRRQMVDDAIDASDFHKAVFLHERPFRFDRLSEYADEYSAWFYENPAVFWMLVGDVWIDTEFPHQQADGWKELLLADIPQRKFFMRNDVEINSLKALPDRISVYRGVSAPDEYLAREYIEDGFSWTKSEAKAKWFAKRFGSKRENAYVARGTLRKEDALAYLNGRGEQEIIAMPGSVFREHLVKVK